VRGEERKVVTVLFADLVGFTGSAEQLDPEDVRATLSQYALRLRVELERRGGTVEKFIGDAVMALFGAPVAHEDDPERAVRAALAIRDALSELNEPGLPIELRVRIGITTGEALIALDARPDEGEGMAAGDVVNAASRLQSAAPVNGILVGEPTFRATRSTIEYREAEPVVAKGKAQPIRVWEAVAARSFVDVEPRPKAPRVGRAEELGILTESFARARRERTPQLVTLVGVPGIGKSRLVEELGASIDALPELIYWRVGRSLPYGDGVTFWALAEMTKAQAGILHSDRAAEAAAKLTAAVRDLLPDESEARWVETNLRPLVGLDVPRDAAGRDEEFAAWRRFFEAMAERRPLVLVFEDLHWADEALLDFVDDLIDRAVGVPMLVLATARADLYERRSEWGGGKRNATTISLSPLSDEETGRLLGSLLERAVLPAETEGELLAVVGGVPLCAEEFVRMLEDRGLLRNGPVLDGTLPLPETIQGIIAARLDALAPEEKAIVQDASVIGRSFWIGALQAIGGRGRRELEEHLHVLERKELLGRERRSSVADERQYVFWHVLVRDVAYGQIPRAQRAEKHRLAGEWIEELGADRADDRSEMLAHHYVAALEFARAAGQATESLQQRARIALREAGDRATALQALPAAVRFYSDAVDLWPEGEPGAHEVRFKYAHALIRAEGRGDHLLEAALEGLAAAGNDEAVAEAEVILADRCWIRGHPEEARRRFERATALLPQSPPSRARAQVLSRFSGFLMADGRYEEAIELALEALSLGEDLELDELRASALTTLGVARTQLGDLSGVDDLRRGVAIAEQAGSFEHIRGYYNLGGTLAELGELDSASVMYAKGRAAAARLGDVGLIRWFDVERLFEDYWAGRWEDALLRVERLLEETAAESATFARFACWLVRAWIRLARDGQIALADVERATAFAREAKTPQALYPALALEAHALIAAGRTDEAAVRLDEVLALWREAGVKLASFWTADVARAAEALGRGQVLTASVEGSTQTQWLTAARALAEGELSEAAALYDRIGSLPDAAFARLRAAESLTGAGAAEAGALLEGALAFYRGVGAAEYVARGEALLAPS